MKGMDERMSRQGTWKGFGFDVGGDGNDGQTPQRALRATANLKRACASVSKFRYDAAGAGLL